jgi:F-type H+-transporting ATPase subunit a
MADTILHIKDAYYFELPKALWKAHYNSLDELPSHLEFLKQDAIKNHASIEDVNRELSGKIVIPQPFGKLKSFYAGESGFLISKFMVIELLIAAILVLLFTRLAPKIASGRAPKGYVWNMFEASLIFIRDGIARPAIDSHDHGHDDHGHGHEHAKTETHTHHDQVQESQGVGHIHGAPKDHHAHPHKHDGDKFLPVLWTMFFFILFSNLFGLLPWLGAPTGSFSVTLALAGIVFATTLFAGMFKFGPLGFLLNQVPKMDLALPVKILMFCIIFPIEILGLCIKHAILAVRLLANMVAGHLVVLAVLGLIVKAAETNGEVLGTYGIVTFISVLGSTAFYCLELFVAFLQAYVFTFLSALFIGAATHQH